MKHNSDIAYVENYKTDTVYTGEFPQGKYISIISDSPTEPVVEDGEIIAAESYRTKITATFIKKKDAIDRLEFTKYQVANGELQSDPQQFKFPLDELLTLKTFLEFLDRSDLKSIASRQIVFGESLTFDDDLVRKIYTLAKTSKGKDLLRSLVVQLMDNTDDFDAGEIIKFGLTPNRLKKRHQELDAFQRVIDDPKIPEVSGVQAELRKIPWIFGPEYVSYDYRPAGEAGIPDGRLKRVDGLSDILEVKLPKAEILRYDHGRHYFSPACSEALGQLTSYLEHYFSEYRTSFNDEDGIEKTDDDLCRYYKPKGILLIGRRKSAGRVGATMKAADNEPKYLRRLMSYFHWIELITYDDLIERARNGLNNLSK
ncbi:MAG: Shedu anti-phage system protein SduA domain-containing protein [bacterium]